MNSLSIRRSLTLAGAAGLALAAVTLPSSPASAAAFTGQASATTSFIAGAGCTLSSNTAATQVVPITSTGGAVPLNVDSTAVDTKTGDPSDTSQLAASVHGTASVTEDAAASLSSFDLSATGSLKVDRSLDAASACAPAATATAFLGGNPVIVAAPATLDLTVKMRGTATGNLTFVLTRLTPSPVVNVVEVDQNLSQTSHRLIQVPAGQYNLTVIPTYQVAQPTSPASPETAAFSFSVHGDMVAPGSASTAQQGTGSKYLALPAAVTCSNQSVVADFQTAAGKKVKKPKKGHKAKKPVIKSTTFYVNGAAVATVKKPNKDTLTALTVPDDVVTVEAVLKLRGKGVVDVRRTYRPCG